MAKISDETLDIVFDLQRQLLKTINFSTYVAHALFSEKGETVESLNSLAELESAKEKLTNSYSQLNTLILRISEYQPVAPTQITDLLNTATERGFSRLDAATASILEVKQYWSI